MRPPKTQTNLFSISTGKKASSSRKRHFARVRKASEICTCGLYGYCLKCKR